MERADDPERGLAAGRDQRPEDAPGRRALYDLCIPLEAVIRDAAASMDRNRR